MATENFRYPALVKGLFRDVPAVTKWLDVGYLSSKLGRHIVPVVMKAKYGTVQNDRKLMSFKESFDELMSNNDSQKYLFFPVKSRFAFNGSDAGSLQALQEDVNRVILEDVEIDKRVWNGFGTKKHSTYFGSQIIAGRGSADSDSTTGTGWHCAAGNNYFIQVLFYKLFHWQ